MEAFQTFGAIVAVIAFVALIASEGCGVRWSKVEKGLTIAKNANNKADALAKRIAVLECAAKGHGKTRVTRTEALAWHLPTGAVVDYYTATSASAPDDWRLADAVHVVITCLDCGAVLSDEWEPKEATDDPA